MATSDLLKLKKDEETSVYAIIGPGGINFTFSSRLYDPQTVESTGINRAKALNSSLFRKYPDGKIFQIYPQQGEVVKGRRIKANMFPEMLNNTTYIPGIQVDL